MSIRESGGELADAEVGRRRFSERRVYRGDCATTHQDPRISREMSREMSRDLMLFRLVSGRFAGTLESLYAHWRGLTSLPGIRCR
jgi:hypothetical protein